MPNLTMFKIKCSKCKNKISKKYDFCPYCGNLLNNKNSQEDYGILGKDDFIEPNIFESFETSLFDKMFENAMKVAEKIIEKQVNISKEQPRPQQSPNIKIPNNNLNVQFYVNGKRVFPQDNLKKIENPQPIQIKNKMLKENAEKFSKLPKQEALSKIRRYSGKIVYELEMPEVKKLEDVLINQLENSIEIKALGKDRVYSKTLNLNLPILSYKLEEGSLILELKA